MEKIDIAIVGTGITGLAVSAFLCELDKSIFVLEKNENFGQESSSRNSEVVHAGIYYPQQSMKAKYCVEGNRLIYEICAKNGISYKKLGKLIAASEESEIEKLDALLEKGKANGVEGLRIIAKDEIRKLEPNVNAAAALLSPNTGIVDTHNLMKYFYTKAKDQGVEFVFNSGVNAINKKGEEYVVTVRDTDRTDFSFLTRVLINCAGLNSDKIAEMAGIDINKAGYSLNYCKGQYFRVGGLKSQMIKHLIYPVPDEKEISLGIHATPDLGGGLRLGPDAQYIEREQANYIVDESKKDYFAKRAAKLLPFIDSEDLTADTAGIRPKLQGPQSGFRDFVLAHEKHRGFKGLINLIGIDSPGLTAAPALAKEVLEIVKELL
ncbi:MAG: NAD(P)/FAD-dependent oxidoreductase [Candidatus Omnitrophica bacterium]|nr:NAD(P)/FAD-dependent oxidoreductase [Candidatus Omnitrophota bacterium]